MAAVKGAQNALKKSPWQGSNQGQRMNSQSTSTSSQSSQWQSNNQNSGMAWNNQTQVRGGVTEARSNGTVVVAGCIWDMSDLALKMLNL